MTMKRPSSKSRVEIVTVTVSHAVCERADLTKPMEI